MSIDYKMHPDLRDVKKWKDVESKLRNIVWLITDSEIVKET